MMQYHGQETKETFVFNDENGYQKEVSICQFVCGCHYYVEFFDIDDNPVVYEFDANCSVPYDTIKAFITYGIIQCDKYEDFVVHMANMCDTECNGDCENCENK